MTSTNNSNQTHGYRRACQRARWALLGGFLVFVAMATAQIPDSKPLVAAMPRDALPNYGLDADGRPTGFSVEVMNLVANKAKLEVRYRVVENWAGAIELLRRGEVDLIPNLGITPDREREFAFSRPLETFRISLFVRADTFGIRNLSDLSGRRIAVVEGNAGVAIMQSKSEYRTVVYKDFPDALFALLSGNVDGLVYPEPWTRSRAKAARVSGEIKQVGEPLIELKRGIAVRADQRALLARLEPAVDTVLASPEYRAAYARWIVEPESFWNVTRLAWTMGLILLIGMVSMFMWRLYTMRRLNEHLREAFDRLESYAKRLAASEDRATLALESAGMGTWDWTIPLNRVDWSDNVEEIFCMAPGTFKRTYDAFLELIEPESRDRVNSAVHEALTGRHDYRIEFPIRTPEGGRKWLAAYGRGFYGTGGEPIRMIGTVWDVTDRKHIELEREQLLGDLERRTAEMEGFVYTISHDLKAPLVTIDGFAQLLDKDLARGDRDKASDSLAEIHKAADGMKRLIEDLLQLARTGQIVGEPKIVELGKLIDELRSRCASHIAQEHAVVELKGPPVRLSVDPVRFGQVLQNLVENALTYHRPGVPPVVHLGATVVDGQRRLYVRDNGIGIPLPYHEKIFGLFQRLDTRTGGTGVGLAIARRIVEMHGGRLWVDSTPGKGSTFWISLPESAMVFETEPFPGSEADSETHLSR